MFTLSVLNLTMKKIIQEFLLVLLIKITLIFFLFLFKELPLVGKSWTFLAGVLGFVLGTTLLIFTAVKCPAWYHYLISYRHRRLEENDSEMFEQEFSADMSSSPSVSGTSSEEPVVIFEKVHACRDEEDGFIEDKYIDIYVNEER